MKQARLTESYFLKKPPLGLFCRSPLYLPASCLFLPLTTNLLARAICKNGNYFALQEISLEQNNGSSYEIWQQGLTFGSLCLLPPLIYVSTTRPVPHQEEVFQETNSEVRYRVNSQHWLVPKRHLVWFQNGGEGKSKHECDPAHWTPQGAWNLLRGIWLQAGLFPHCWQVMLTSYIICSLYFFPALPNIIQLPLVHIKL